jgi:putative proteasome-type protease
MRESTTSQRLKTPCIQQGGERVLVIQSAGNLATTQSIVSLLNERIQGQHTPNLMQMGTMYDAATLVGETVREVIHRDSAAQQNSSTIFGCNMLLGGQIGSEVPRLFHIYPEGNFIEATNDTPTFRLARVNTASRLSIGC